MCVRCSFRGPCWQERRRFICFVRRSSLQPGGGVIHANSPGIQTSSFLLLIQIQCKNSWSDLTETQISWKKQQPQGLFGLCSYSCFHVCLQPNSVIRQCEQPCSGLLLMLVQWVHDNEDTHRAEMFVCFYSEASGHGVGGSVGDFVLFSLKSACDRNLSLLSFESRRQKQFHLLSGLWFLWISVTDSKNWQVLHLSRFHQNNDT